MAENDPLLLGLGAAIRAYRFERDEMSQQRLGHVSGVHHNYISGIERGERRPTLDTIAKLAWSLGARPSELLARAEREAERRGTTWPIAPRGEESSWSGDAILR